MRNILFTICLLIIIFFIGAFCGYKFLPPKEIIKEVEVIKKVDKIVYRDYSKIDCCLIAEKYDITPMQINYNVNELKSTHTNIDVVWRLYDRQGVENVNIPVHQSGNWKFYTGITVGALAIGGISYLIMR